MELSLFLDALFQSDFSLFDQSITWFLCEGEYPIYFFSRLSFYISQHYLPVIFIKSGYGSHTIQEQLTMSFLGSRHIYFIHPQALSPSERKKVLNFLASYQGPHRILCPILKTEVSYVSSADTSKKISIPEYISSSLFKKLTGFIDSSEQQSANLFIKKLTPRCEKLSLDMGLILLNYKQVMGRNSEQFFVHSLSKLVPPQRSLFSLSQTFFAGDSQKFFNLWAQVGPEFGPQFWITFWSEQVWRAALYCQYMSQDQRAQAKRIGYRLPFSFLNNDWRKHNTAMLMHVHRYLCILDQTSKRGSSFSPFEQLYTKFFLRDFATFSDFLLSDQVV